jgi:Tol biopolymer transport system component
MRDRALRLALLMGALCALAFPVSASAAFPGTNGRIVFVSDRNGNKEIYSAAADGSDPLRLTTNIAADTDPVYSPDGQKIAFTRGLDIWVMNADGSGQVAITGIEGPDNQPAWSPDGTQIAYISNHSTSGGGTTGPQLFVKNADKLAVPRQVTASGSGTGASRTPAWSPAGDQIAYANTADGTFEIHTIAASATEGTE